MEKQRTIRLRILPTKEQEEKIKIHISHSRNTRNIMLGKVYDELRNTGNVISKKDMRLQLTKLVNSEEYSYLKQVSKSSLVMIIDDLDYDISMWFKGYNNKPKFHSKKDEKLFYRVRSDEKRKFFYSQGKLRIEKLGRVKVSNKSIKRNIKLINEIQEVDRLRKATINFNGKYWIISIRYRADLVNSRKPRELTNEVIGIDLGIKTLATCSNGKSYKNINKSSKVRKLEKQLKRKQRQVSRKYEMNKIDNKFVKTKNIIKLEKEIKLLSIRISNIRNNHLHNMTKEIVEQLPQEIVIEDLNVQGMLKNKYLSKSIRGAGFYTIREMLTYKCEDRGILLTIANRWYPSSQTCSTCGARKTKQQKLSLNERTFNCGCGSNLDRDYNASLNLKNYRYSKWYKDNISSL